MAERIMADQQPLDRELSCMSVCTTFFIVLLGVKELYILAI